MVISNKNDPTIKFFKGAIIIIYMTAITLGIGFFIGWLIFHGG